MKFLFLPTVTGLAGPSGSTFSPARDGYIESVNAAYATARAGSGMGFSDNWLQVGQILSNKVYTIWQCGLEFDTASLSGLTVTDVTLQLFGGVRSALQDFDVEVYEEDFGGTITTADWLNEAAIAALGPKLAQLPSIEWHTGANNFTTFADFYGAINTVGPTRIWLLSSRNRLMLEPLHEADEFVTFHALSDTDVTRRPKLFVEAS